VDIAIPATSGEDTMKRALGWIVAGGLLLGLANSAGAQVAVSVGTPYTGVAVGAPAVGVAAYANPFASYPLYSSYYAAPLGATTTYSSGYAGYIGPGAAYPGTYAYPAAYVYPTYGAYYYPYGWRRAGLFGPRWRAW
jgi:hypothetical protein